MGSSGRTDRTLACPTCAAAVRIEPRPPHFPFCCLRCQLADLGKWLDEDYRVPGDPVGPRPETDD